MIPHLVAVDEPILDLDQVQFWIELLHGDSQGFLHVSAAGSWAGKCFTIDDTEGILDYVKALDTQSVSGIYLRACTLLSPPRGGSRGSEQDSSTFPGLWADIDLAGPGHRTTKPLPTCQEHAELIIQEAGLPEPTLWISSGGGLYPWWLLRQPEILTEQNFEAIKELSAQWQDILAATAARLGFHYGSGIGDLARVLRIPGTVNRKVPGAPTPCRLISQDGHLFSLDDLSGAATRSLELVARLTPTRELSESSHERHEPATGSTPFNDYELATDWVDILEPYGWRLTHQVGRTRYWVRPGKSSRDGHSATTGQDSSRDRLYVFSTETEFTPNVSYTKGAAYAVLAHGGNMSLAARELRRRGFGVVSSNGHGTVRQVIDPLTPLDNSPQQSQISVPESDYELNDNGNAERLAHFVGNQYRYSEKEKFWYKFTGTHWKEERTGAIIREVRKVAAALYEEAKIIEVDDPKRAKKIRNFAISTGNLPRINAAVKLCASQEGISVDPNIFNEKTHLLNLKNGTLNLATGEFGPHHASNYLSKVFNASYDPAATAPRWERFVAEAIPDTELRNYVQRALGYTLLGDADQRSIFLIHGPSGTGKSQFTKAIQLIFGDYGANAAPSTFKVRRNLDGLSNDVHSLRGKRFVTTSETSADTLLDEELIKRITGNDTITSRGLYQEFIEWNPHCVIWMATNHLPQLNSDDGAIWNRVKPIPMTTVFAGRDDEVGAFAKNVLLAEADGILNWLLDGLRRYREMGLSQEPAIMTQVLEVYKSETDTIQQFVTDSVEEKVLIKHPDAQVPAQQIYAMYKEWSKNNGCSPLGIRRFRLRMSRLGYEQVRSDGIRWRGLQEGTRGALGTMFPLRL